MNIGESLTLSDSKDLTQDLKISVTHAYLLYAHCIRLQEKVCKLVVLLSHIARASIPGIGSRSILYDWLVMSLWCCESSCELTVQTVW